MSEKAHWENVYNEKSAQEVSWYQPLPAVSLQLIENAGIGKTLPLIDVGGGASTLDDGLLAKGYADISVLDVSGTALAVARARLGNRANDMHWIEADITRFQPVRRYALWHDRAVFHFLTAAESRRHYVEALKKGLLPGGTLIMAAFATGGPTRCSGLDIVQYAAEKATAELGPLFQLQETLQEEHLTPSGKTQAFNYFRFRRVA
jgi:SAM-dependent methyltransferase